MLSIGIDSGSTATKGILFSDENGGVILRRFLIPTPFRPQSAILEAWETLCGECDTRPYLTLTGYGRKLVDYADKQVTEISCHGIGARWLHPQTRTVIDIGGQDSKVIRLDEQGHLTDFLMNDKCAAGTGRFLDVISRTLGTDITAVDDTIRGIEPHAISSMCTVFAESEVISLRSSGVEPQSILSGIVNSMAQRTAGFAKRLSTVPSVLFSGGVSRSQAFCERLSQHLGAEVITHPDGQFAGAIGAAIYGIRQLQKQAAVTSGDLRS